MWWRECQLPQLLHVNRTASRSPVSGLSLRRRRVDGRAVRVYRTAWAVVVWFVVGVSLAAGSISIGAALMVVSSLVAAAIGVILALTLVDAPGRRVAVARAGALWGAGSGVVLAGLPEVLGGWTVAVGVPITAGAPSIVTAAARSARRRRMAGSPAPVLERLSDRDLEGRLHDTYDEVRRRGSSTAEVLRIVQERARLLDELERRDPEHFEQWLDRAGWG